MPIFERSTYVSDRATSRVLVELTRTWKVSKSEAIRRALLLALESVRQELVMSPEQALDKLSSLKEGSEQGRRQEAEALIHDIKTERAHLKQLRSNLKISE